eukprot:gene16743-19903_t
MVSKNNKIMFAIFVVCALITMITLLAVLVPRSRENHGKSVAAAPKRNVIFMVADGFGPAGATLARIAKKTMDKSKPLGLSMDNYLQGTTRTYSSDSWVTDSAAAATAYSCGIKSYNGAIGVNTNKTAVGTMYEAAQARGVKTGLVFTTRVSDATPSSFFAHSDSRKNENFITSQLWDKNMTVILGGGGMYYDKQEELNSKKYNYTLVRNRDEMMKVENGKILGIFADYNLPFEIDRRTFGAIGIPTLKEMTVKALDLINQNNDKGFMLMVEGSQIDLAGHGNDAAGQIYETLAFDEAVQAAMDFAEKDGNTIVVITADHETGGLTLANQLSPSVGGDYVWSPEILLTINASSTTMASFIAGNITDATDPADYPAIINKIVMQYTNLPAGKNLTTDDLTSLSKYARKEGTLYWMLGKVLSSKASVGWTTSGHTGVDVNLYYYYADLDDSYITPLSHNHENTDLALFFEHALQLNLTAETVKLVNFNTHGLN